MKLAISPPTASIRIFLCFLLLNSPVTFATLDWGLSRPILNIDFLLPIFLACITSIGASIIFFIFYLTDVISSLSIAYHFDSTANFMRSANATPEIFNTLSSEPQLMWLMVPPILWCFVVKWQPSIRIFSKEIRGEFLSTSLIAAILVFADINTGTSMLVFSDRPKAGPNIAGSPFASQFKKALTENPPSASLATDQTIFSSEEKDLLQGNRAVVLIVFESMGLPASPEAINWLDSMVRSASANHTSLRQVGFKGSTVSAELRHLCGVVSSMPDDVEVDHCLPMLARAAGMRTFAAHGNSGATFNRNQWWPKLGLDQIFFREDLTRRGALICDFAYKAICDRSLIEFIFRELKPADFAYGLTISTHLPIPKLDSDMPGDFCAIIKSDPTPCRIIWQQGQVLSIIAKEVDNTEFPVVTYVVGDHAPPFLSSKNREAFSPTETIGWKIENSADSIK